MRDGRPDDHRGERRSHAAGRECWRQAPTPSASKAGIAASGSSRGGRV
ncbi:hypothetical protein C7S16_2271 [Burkholderia thailandensis]|uniref:Uncharacterized protein n=1 Tax=Burkholderia thailandensis TaxID=57975 RepID=A0AAW9CZR3_BURTH|nr:hypothetical protein [Burkholderia thailandensis]